MHWYGGETTMITHVGEEKNINFRFNFNCQSSNTRLIFTESLLVVAAFAFLAQQP
jgi:hypothetical protein